MSSSYTDPIDKKRPPFSMFILWLVMQANYVNLYIGLSAAYAGTSLISTIGALFGATLCYTIYGLIAGMNGAVTGKRLVQLAEDEFGKIGGYISGILIIIVPSAWYCFNIIVASDVIILLYPEYNAWRSQIALSLIVLMSFNNLFGFNGILKFAQYIVAPLLLVGIVVALSSGGLQLVNDKPVDMSFVFDFTAIQLISTSLLGNATWGNEEDFWRYAKPTLKHCSLPIITANFLGLFVFSVIGYLGARYIVAANDIEALKQVTLLMGFGSIPIAAFLTFIHVMALNDSNLFSALNGVERFLKKKRSILTIIMLPVLLLECLVFLRLEIVDLLFMIAGFCGTVLPSVGLSVWCSRKVASPLPLRKRKVAFLLALILGLLMGVLTSREGTLIPGVGYSFGVSVVQAWLVTLCFFYLITKISLRRHYKAQY